MSTLDRRSGHDRRAVPRYSVNIDVEWEGLIGRKNGVVSDISQMGCFVLCSGEVEDGETVKIFLPITPGMKVQFWGEVVNHIYEIGFAVRFIETSPAQKEFLEKFIDSIA